MTGMGFTTPADERRQKAGMVIHQGRRGRKKNSLIKGYTGIEASDHCHPPFLLSQNTGDKIQEPNRSKQSTSSSLLQPEAFTLTDSPPELFFQLFPALVAPEH